MPRLSSIGVAMAAASTAALTLACGDLFDPPVPTALELVSTVSQTAQVGTVVADTPTVRVLDQDGDAMADVQVIFAVTAGGGSVEQDTAATGEDGVATSGGWTLGTAVGENVLTGTAAGLAPVTFTAIATPGPPAAVDKVEGDAQTAQVGSAVATPPAVRVEDQFGNPVPNVAVTFSITAGGGSVSGGAATTDADGVARVGGWTLGTAAGSNSLRATAGGVSPVTFTATGTPGPAAALVKTAGDGQSAVAGSAVSIRPTVRSEDAFGNAVAGVAVTFTVTSGGGSITGSSATTGSGGEAVVGSWTLGSSAGENTLRAAAGGLPAVTFTATATAASVFDIGIVILGTMTASQRAAFTDAAARWEEVIVGDLPDFGGTLSAGGCQPEEITGIDDVVIYATIEPIDGPGGTLGRAGPCFFRAGSGPPFPLTGIMEFDSADVAGLESNGAFRDVILHEMGHVLGIGTLWDQSPNAFLSGAGGSDPFFTGAAAIAAFDAAGGSARVGNRVPVENTGGSGTRDSHWRESVHDNELMTGFLNLSSNPLSAITVASLEDMGYVVDRGAADAYTVPFPTASLRAPGAGVIQLVELPPPTPIGVPMPGPAQRPRH